MYSFSPIQDNFSALEVVVIGVSAGGMSVLSEIFQQLRPDFRLPLLIVQHLHPHQGNFHIEYFSEIAPIPVQEMEEKQPIHPARIYFAPANYHALIESDKTFALSVDEKVNYARPSIDVLFETASEVFQHHLLGIILTGANRDGAKGLRQIADFGGITIVQDPDTAQFAAMPQFALEATPSSQALNLSEIVVFLNSIHPKLSNLSKYW